MTQADLDRVMEIAGSLKQAPQWPRSAYLAALEPESAPPRIALVAESPSGAMESHPSDKNKGVARVGHPESMGQSNQVVGFAVASLMPPEAELEIIAVAPATQRRGVAARLFEALIAEFYTAYIKGIMLEVRATNQPALALYRRLGFVETGRRPRYYHDPVEDAILMRLRL
jgi:ribosomal-protein-alanine N-acetyltransferase